MNVAIFGASGGTGKLLTSQCLAAGYNVTALVRTPSSFRMTAEPTNRLRVIEGNAFDPSTVRLTAEGADLVLSALGARSLKKEDVLERAIPLIISAMRDANVRRVIVLGAAGTLSTSLDKQPAWRRWFAQKILYNTLLKWPITSQISQWNNLSNSDLDWTIVMPPMLTNAPARGSYRVDGDALPRNGSRISRADVADFMMQQIGNPQWIRRGVYLSW
jgi:putative NADH-flavin reductase